MFKYKFIVVITLIFFLSGCSTFVTRLYPFPPEECVNNLFPATECDLKMITDSRTEFESFIMIFDLPLSFATDIILFPYDFILMVLDSKDKG